MQMELAILTFVKAHRENNFPLYVEALESLAPWFFALDNTKYALKIYNAYLSTFKTTPGNTGSFLNPRTSFQASQSIRHTSNGAIGLTESPVAFRRWMVAGPQTAQLLQEFESQLKGNPTADQKNEHHEQGLCTQKAFQSHVKNLVNTKYRK